MPTVSVIIPTYNHREWILQTLDSVFAQTFTDYEVIVIDDGSPDDTATLLQPLVNQKRIQLIRQTNAGQAAARNTGVAKASGDFIAFLDDDDLWPTDKLAWQIGFLETDQTAVAVGGSLECIDECGVKGYSPISTHGQITFEQLFSGSPFWSPGQTLIRTSAMREIGPLDTTVPGADDFDFWLRLSGAGRILTDPRLALLYRKHSANASKNFGQMYRSCRRVANKHLVSVSASKRRQLNIAANRWLYDYLGSNTLRRFTNEARNMRLIHAADSLWLWTRLVRSLLSDREIRSAVRKDLREVATHHLPLR